MIIRAANDFDRIPLEAEFFFRRQKWQNLVVLVPGIGDGCRETEENVRRLLSIFGKIGVDPRE